MKHFKTLIDKIEETLIDENVELIENESEYSLCQTLKSSRLKDVLKLNIEEYFSFFKGSLRITVTSKSQESTIFHYEKGVQFFYEELENLASEDDETTFIFVINKEQFIREQYGIGFRDKYNIKIFKSKDTFFKYIKDNTIFSLQDRLFAPERKLIVLIPDLENSISNEIVSLIGEEQLLKTEKEKEYDSTIFDAFSERIKLRNIEVRWDDKVKFINPEYFYFEEICDVSLKVVMRQKLVDCVLVFLSDSVKIENDQYVLQFNGYKCTRVILGGFVEEVLTSSNCCLSFELYRWTYQSNFSDKIMIVRNIISKYLMENEKSNYNVFLLNVADILNASKSNYQIFFQNKIDVFFEDRKKIAQYTFEKTKEVEKEISGLTDSMTKNVVTAIGVIIAAIIANSTKSSVSIVSIRIALTAYLFYLAISFVYSLITPVISLVQQCMGNKHLIKYYTMFVPEEEINKVQGNVFRNKLIFFWIYWTFSFLLMAGLIGISVYALINLASILKEVFGK